MPTRRPIDQVRAAEAALDEQLDALATRIVDRIAADLDAVGARAAVPEPQLAAAWAAVPARQRAYHLGRWSELVHQELTGRGPRKRRARPRP